MFKHYDVICITSKQQCLQVFNQLAEEGFRWRNGGSVLSDIGEPRYVIYHSDDPIILAIFCYVHDGVKEIAQKSYDSIQKMKFNLMSDYSYRNIIYMADIDVQPDALGSFL